MGNAKEIIIKVIPAKIANPFVKAHHYSGKVVNNSSLHFGVFYKGKLHGVMSFGSPTSKEKVLGLVVDQGGLQADWNGMLELNRMAFDEVLPKNSESRAIAIAIKLIKKNAPHIKWILTFADGCQCGDGTIYRASGFKLTQIKKNAALRINPETGEPMHAISAHHKKMAGEYRTWQPIDGYMLRYIKILDDNYRLNCDELDYSAIQGAGAGMYKGEKR